MDELVEQFVVIGEALRWMFSLEGFDPLLELFRSVAGRHEESVSVTRRGRFAADIQG